RRCGAHLASSRRPHRHRPSWRYAEHSLPNRPHTTGNRQDCPDRQRRRLIRLRPDFKEWLIIWLTDTCNPRPAAFVQPISYVICANVGKGSAATAELGRGHYDNNAAIKTCPFDALLRG